MASPVTQAGAGCKATGKSLLGAWERNGENGDFEEMEFLVESKSNAFNSWLHHRPEITGASWALKWCTLTIKPTTGMPDFTYTIINVSKNSLQIQGVDDHLVGRYKRINIP